MESFTAWTTQVKQVFDQTLAAISQYLPNLIGAVVLMIFGWLVARVLRLVAVRLARWFDHLIFRFYPRRAVDRPKVPPASAQMLGNIVFWLVILFFLIAAMHVLGLSLFLGWLDRLVNYLPTLFAGGLIILAGILFGKLANDLIRATAIPANLHQRMLLGRGAQVAIVVSALVIGADQIGIKITFFVILVTIILSAILGGLALAISLGSRTYVANLIGAHALRQVYRQGQRLRIADYEGRLLEIGLTTLVLETPEGRTTLPAKLYLEAPSVLRLEDNNDNGTT
jgi:small-conductance mechanosensitive channel